MIYIKNLKKDIGIRNLFTIEDLVINPDEKIALIGNNGAGKTSFFRILVGQDKEYTGSVDLRERPLYLLNAWDNLEGIAAELYSKANLTYGDKYSPGELQRLNLLELLADRDSFLLMDEPSSHLDFEQKEALIEELRTRQKGYILISHDRDFINKTCNKIFELSNGKLEVFNGDYAFYLEERLRRRKFAQREYDNYIGEKKRLENIASNIKKQASKVKRTPSRMGNSEARLHKMGGQENKKKLDRQVRAIRSRIDQLEPKEKPKEESLIKLSIPEEDKIYSKILIKGEDLNKAFGEKIIFKKAKFTIENNSKLALMGPNGSGKTTLLKMIIEAENIWLHPKIKIGYYSQLEEIIDQSKTILENVFATSIYDQAKTRIILGRLGFRRDDVHKKLGVLSDGERAKVKLAKLMTSDFNFLILDEPTNYLDIRAIEALEELLKSYDRSLIFVTHDLAFINNVADSLLLIEESKLTGFKGNYTSYQKSRQGSERETDKDDFLLDFRLASINGRLAMEIPSDERKKLEDEYKELIDLRKQRTKKQ